ncbi:MAG TPA: S41 family peptidase [Vicinamibacterales bacterium]|nr:S41 family peptidase [Vicinamibacterales bacterium]
MTSRTRFWVLAVSTPIIAFAVLGGYLGQVWANDATFQHLRVFDDVFSLVLNNYVEEVNVQKAMHGAMDGLAEGLDADSGFLTPDLARTVGTPLGAADIGVDVTRQYYLRIIDVRAGSPAAKAGLRTGDFIRAIDDKSTRDMSTYEGTRLLHGQAGSKLTLLVIRGNAADPHTVPLVRERATGPELTSRMAGTSTGYVHVADFENDTAAHLKQAVATLTKEGASRFVIDVRNSAHGDLDDGIAAARLFVKSGTLAIKQTKTGKTTIAADAGDGAIAAPVVLLVDSGTAGPAEVFAAALSGNERAQLVGEHTQGRAAHQRLVTLPDGSGLYLTVERYLTPKSAQLHEKGLEPDVEVDEPDVDFGSPAPTTDPTLQRAIQMLTAKQAA